jgi:flagellar protein FliS
LTAAQNYLETSILTKNPGQIVVLLYDGAIQFLRKARKAIDSKDWQAKSRYLGRAREIVWQLNESLNLNEGGPVAPNLRIIYNFLLRYLCEINSKNDAEMLEKAIGILVNLGSAWSKIAV